MIRCCPSSKTTPDLMCGRYSLVGETLDANALAELRDLVGEEPVFVSRYNIAPSQKAPVIRLRDGKASLEDLTWNFRPEWMASRNDAQPNARAETLFSGRMFKPSVATRRCLVPATGWYEWRKVTGGKRPHTFHTPDSQITFAGIWTRWLDADGAAEDSYAIVTTEASQAMAPYHDRMPVILAGAGRREWLEATLSEPDDVEHLKGLLRPYAASLDIHPVSTFVNSPRHEGPRCLGSEEDVFG